MAFITNNDVREQCERLNLDDEDNSCGPFGSLLHDRPFGRECTPPTHSTLSGHAPHAAPCASRSQSRPDVSPPRRPPLALECASAGPTRTATPTPTSTATPTTTPERICYTPQLLNAEGDPAFLARLYATLARQREGPGPSPLGR